MSHALFAPLTLREVTLPNRIAMSPMCQYMARDGVATAWHMAHLGARAVGGAGLVTTEATAVEPRGRLTPGDLGLWTETQADALRPVAEFIRSQGSVPGVQLAHAGRKGSRSIPWEGGGRALDPDKGWRLIAPSAVPFGDYDVPEEMDEADIDAVEAAFVHSAKLAARAGFLVLNLHFAHGYLLHAFLSPLSNRRIDAYGGSLENRARFPLRVLRAVRAAWPHHLPIIVRLSCEDWSGGGFGPDEAATVASELVAAGADLVECSSAGLVPDEAPPAGPGYQVHLARHVREAAGIPTGAVGMIWGAQQAEDIVAGGHADLVSLGRAILDDPYWARHAAEALDLDPGWPLPYRRAIGRLRSASAAAAAERGGM